MPELPEVETSRRSFAAAIECARVLELWMGKALRWPLGQSVDFFAGLKVTEVGRRGKYIVLYLQREVAETTATTAGVEPVFVAEPAGVLLLHLGMSGSLRFGTALPPRGVHDHVDLRTSQGTLRLNDPRRFGALVYVPSLQSPLADKLLGNLGVEPLEFDAATERYHPSIAFTTVWFAKALKTKKSPIKQVLLAGQLVVGVGNIYASEACFYAGVRPTRPACKLTLGECERLHIAVIRVLSAALEAGGSTLRNFSSAVGVDGHFQLQTRVYDREGEPCKTCGVPVKRVVQQQRSSFYCPKCQK